MAYSIQLPDGTYVTDIPDTLTPEEAKLRILQQRPEFAGANAKPGFVAALKAGVENLKGDIGGSLAGKLGITPIAEAEAYKRKKDIAAREVFRPTQEGWLDAPVTKTTELLGGSLPYIAAPVAAGAAATFAGAPGLAAAGLGALASGAQFTGSNLSRQTEEGKTLEQASLPKAAAAAVPMAVLDLVSFRMMPAIRGLFGKAGLDLSAEAAQKIAQQGIAKTLGTYGAAAAKTAGVEGTTEAAQAFFERLQADLNTLNPDARKEYLENFIGGAVLGGTVGIPGKMYERSRDRSKQEDEQRKQGIQGRLQSQQQEEQYKNSEAYVADVAQKYQALEARKAELLAARGPRPGKDATEADRQRYTAIGKQIGELQRDELGPMAREYNRLRPRIEAAKQAALDPVGPAPETVGPVVPPLVQPPEPSAEEAFLSRNYPGAVPSQEEFDVAKKQQEEAAARAAQAAQAAAMEKEQADLERGLTEGYAAALPPDAFEGLGQQAAQQIEAARRAQVSPEEFAFGDGQLPPASAEANSAVVEEAAQKIAQNPRMVQALLAGNGKLKIPGLPASLSRAVYDRVRKLEAEAAQAAAQERADLLAGMPAKAKREKAPTAWEQAAAGQYEQAQQEQESEATRRDTAERRAEANAPFREAFQGDEAQPLVPPADRTPRSGGAPFQLTPYPQEARVDTSREAILSRIERLLQRADLLDTTRAFFERRANVLPTDPNALQQMAEALYRVETQGVGTTRPGLQMPVFKQKRKFDTAPAAARAMPAEAVPSEQAPAVEGPEQLPQVPVQQGADVTRIRQKATKQTSEIPQRELPETGGQPVRKEGDTTLRKRSGAGAPDYEIEDAQRLAESGARADEGAQGDLFDLSQRPEPSGPGGRRYEGDARGVVFADPNTFEQQMLDIDTLLDGSAADYKRAIQLIETNNKATQRSIADREKRAQQARLQEVDARLPEILTTIDEQGAAWRRLNDMIPSLDKTRDALEVAHGRMVSAIKDFRDARANAKERGVPMRDAQKLFRQAVEELEKARSEHADHAALLRNFATVSTMLKETSPDAAETSAVVEQLQAGMKLVGAKLNFLDKEVADYRAEARVYRQMAEVARRGAGTLPYSAEDVARSQAELEDATQDRNKARKDAREAYEAVEAAQADLDFYYKTMLGTARGSRSGSGIAPLADAFPRAEQTQQRREADKGVAQERQDNVPAPLDTRVVEARPGTTDPEVERAVEEARLEAARQGVPPAQMKRRETGIKKLVDLVGLKRQLGKDEAKARALTAEVEQMRAEQSERAIPPVLTRRIERLQASMAAGEEALKTAPTAAARAPILAKLAEDTKALRATEDKIARATPDATFVFKGMGGKLKEQAALQYAIALRRQQIDVIETAQAREQRAQAASMRREEEAAATGPVKSDMQLAIERARALREGATGEKKMTRGQAKKAVEAEKPSTSGEPLEKSQAKKAAQGQKTAFTGTNATTKLFSESETSQPLTTFTDDGKPVQVRALTTTTENFKVSPRTAENAESVGRIRQELKNTFPTEGMLEGPKSKVFIYGSVDAFLQSPAGTQYKGNPEFTWDRAAVALPEGKVVLFANNIDSGKALGVLLHEVGVHLGFRKIFTASEMKMLANAIRNWADSPKNTFDRRVARAALKRVEAGGTTDAQADEEIIAYAVEEATTQGMAPSAKQSSGIMAWLNRVRDKFVAALEKFLGTPAKITLRDVVDMAYGAANMELRGIEPTPRADALGAPTEPMFSTRATYTDPNAAAAGELAEKLIAPRKRMFDGIKAAGLDIGTTALRARTQLIDALAPVEEFSRYIAKEQGDSLAATQLMYNMRMHGQKSHFMGQAVSTGVAQLKKIKRGDGRTEFMLQADPGANLRDVAKELEGAPGGSPDAINGLFSLYLVAERAKTVGPETLNYGTDANGTPLVTQKMLDEAVESMGKVPGLIDRFKRAAATYNQYNKDLVRLLAQTGAISDGKAADLVASGNYVPYYREQNGNVVAVFGGREGTITIGSLKNQPHLKELIGGDQRILDFTTSAVQNTNMIMDMALRNLASKSAAYELKKAGLAALGKDSLSGPDVFYFYDNGEKRAAKVNTEAIGIPAELFVQGMSGIPMAQLAGLRFMSLPAKVLRNLVVLSPVYALRQLFRDSVAASIISGSNGVPVISQLKHAVGSESRRTLEQRGVTGGQLLTGTNEDASRILRDAQGGKMPWMKALHALEQMSMGADAVTRASQYESYKKQGLSEMEATFSSMESMNFSKRGMSPTMHALNQMVPFLNAQIQGLDVLYKALAGKMPMGQQLAIRRKLITRGMLLSASTLAYAAAMSDEDEYKNALPEERYNNWFVRVPGVEQMVRIPIPFEIGYIFKALPEAAFNLANETDDQRSVVKAFKAILKNTVPGGSSMLDVKGIPIPVPIPQAAKPAIEAFLGKSFFTGRDIESAQEKKLDPEERYRDTTTEVAKALGDMGGFSPIVVDHLLRGYFSSMGMLLAQTVSAALPSENVKEGATKRLSDYPVIGTLFQRQDAGGIINAMYERAEEVRRAADTYENLVATGQRAEAKAYLQNNANKIALESLAGNFRQKMGELTKLERWVRASDKAPAEKRELLDKLQARKTELATHVRERFSTSGV